MEFQNQPFQDLKERVRNLEGVVADAFKAFVELERRINVNPAFSVRAEKSETVRKKQDDARRQSFFKTVEKVQEENEGGG